MFVEQEILQNEIYFKYIVLLDYIFVAKYDKRGRDLVHKKILAI